MDASEIVTGQAMAAVLAGVIVGQNAGDMTAAEPIVRQLWPDELELSGYEVAAELVLAMAGAFGITMDQLMQLATIVKTELDEATA